MNENEVDIMKYELKLRQRHLCEKMEQTVRKLQDCMRMVELGHMITVLDTPNFAILQEDITAYATLKDLQRKLGFDD